MIYITGDIHGDVLSLCSKIRREKADQIGNTVILLGDVAVNYFGDYSDTARKEILFFERCNFLCVQGNHELRPQNISTYKLRTWNGGKVYVEPEFPNIMFAKDGEIYNIEGRSFLVLGGAYSVDKYIRLAREMKWFPDEQISKPMRTRIFNKIKDKEVDYVLSHTCPLDWQPTYLFLDELDQSTIDSTMEEWLSEVEKNISYKHWFFGHYHGDKEINDKATLFFKRFAAINEFEKEN